MTNSGMPLVLRRAGLGRPAEGRRWRKVEPMGKDRDRRQKDKILII